MGTNQEPTTLLQRIVGLHGDTRYTDLIVQCGERRWRVHKAIVCAGCKFFEKACGGRFKEAANNTVTLEDDPPNAVAAMLRYLYTDTFDDSSDQEGCPPLVFNIYVHTIGDKYDLPGLTAIAESKFGTRMQNKEFNLVELADAIRETYKFETDHQKSFRQRLMNHIMGPGQNLLQDDAFIQVAKSTPAFAAELVAETVRRFAFNSGPFYECYSCEQPMMFTAKAFSEVQGRIKCPHCGYGNYATGLKTRPFAP